MLFRRPVEVVASQEHLLPNNKQFRWCRMAGLMSVSWFPGAEPLIPLGAVQVVTDPSGRFLYVLDQTCGLYAYEIDSISGELTEIAGSPFETPDEPTSLAFAESGSETFLYVAAGTGRAAPVSTSIAVYFVDPWGALVPLTDYTVAGESSTIAAARNHLYIAGFHTNGVTAFSIGPSGELSEDVSELPFATDTGPYSIAVDPAGSVLYTANAGARRSTEGAAGSISAFTIDSSGALTPVRGNPQPIPVQGPLSIDPTGRFLFVPEASGVSVYAINTSSGVLAAVAGSPFSAGTHGGRSLAGVGRPDKRIAIVNGGPADIPEFTLARNTVLTPLPGSPVPVKTNSCCLAIISDRLTAGYGEIVDAAVNRASPAMNSIGRPAA
jgi:6-phosphogluconolactonase (cycloisomerase 2 family)